MLIAPLLLVSAGTAAPAQSPETGIAFANRDGISEWKVVADDRIYIRSGSGDWYLARTTAPCRRMKNALLLGFDTGSSDRLDRFGAIIAEGRRCPLASLVRAPEPPAGWREKRGRRP
jgi:hypothetical protein